MALGFPEQLGGPPLLDLGYALDSGWEPCLTQFQNS
jgi:hypothetical protein